MKDRTVRSVMTICCVCVFLLLMCTFFIEEAHAASILKGTTTRNEQTVQLTLKKGTALITVQDPDSWVYAHLQTTGNNKLGTAVNGDTLLAGIGQKKTFTVPVKKTGTYYLYLHGTNKGASYSVQRVAPGGKLKLGAPKVGTSYANNKSVVYYKVDVPAKGRLSVKVTDASYRYPGYSKVTLSKGKKNLVYSEEEHLIKGLGYQTYYGVSKGTYYIGVRSSSELYKITCSFTPVKTTRAGKDKNTAVELSTKKSASSIITSADKNKRWYKVVLPKGSKAPRQITVKAKNSNHNVSGGIRVTMVTKKNNGKSKLKKAFTLNNSSVTKSFKPFKKKDRVVYIRINSVKGATGTYTVICK